jgi:putative ubiquitin-RnfH superfamily antitoxin RatB of RatAB toxin-antitoxin module
VVEQVGIFSRPVSHDTLLREGDRVEVYRPLKVDPKERRRQVAAES